MGDERRWHRQAPDRQPRQRAIASLVSGWFDDRVRERLPGDADLCHERRRNRDAAAAPAHQLQESGLQRRLVPRREATGILTGLLRTKWHLPHERRRHARDSPQGCSKRRMRYFLAARSAPTLSRRERPGPAGRFPVAVAAEAAAPP